MQRASYWDCRSGICLSFTPPVCWSCCCWCWAWGKIIAHSMSLLYIISFPLPFTLRPLSQGSALIILILKMMLGQRTRHICICYSSGRCSLQWWSPEKSHYDCETAGMWNNVVIMCAEEASWIHGYTQFYTDVEF